MLPWFFTLMLILVFYWFAFSCIIKRIKMVV
jgi:hypothetical protein